MHIDLLAALVANVRQRISEGDYPITPAYPVETLENAVLDLAASTCGMKAEGRNEPKPLSPTPSEGGVESQPVARGLWAHEDNMVEHSHSEFGQGYFCTGDAFVDLAALASPTRDAAVQEADELARQIEIVSWKTRCTTPCRDTSTMTRAGSGERWPTAS